MDTHSTTPVYDITRIRKSYNSLRKTCMIVMWFNPDACFELIKQPTSRIHSNKIAVLYINGVQIISSIYGKKNCFKKKNNNIFLLVIHLE